MARRRARRAGKREVDAALHETLADWFEVDPMFLSEVALNGHS